jgi:hypothetical protein
MGAVVYSLCALTSIICAVLLIRGWRRTRTRLLLWSSLCFIFLALNNSLLVVDMVLLPGYDLALWRALPALVALSLLVYGLVSESQ